MNHSDSYFRLLLIFSTQITYEKGTALEVHVTLEFKPLNIIMILVTFQNNKNFMMQAMTS